MEPSTLPLKEQGLQALRAGNLDAAVELLGRAVMTDGQDAEVLASLGVAYSQKGQHDLAVRALESAVAMQPEEARFQFNLGVALESAGDAPAAVAPYREALRLNPEHAQARARLQALGGPAPSMPAERSAAPLAGTAASAAPWQPGWQPTQEPAATPAPPPAAASAPWLAEPSDSAASTVAALSGVSRGPGPAAPRPAGLGLVVVLSTVVGVVEMISGGLVLVGANAAKASQAAQVAATPDALIFMVTGFFLFMLGVGTLVTSHFLSKGCNWARLTFIGVICLGILLNLAQAFLQTGAHVPIPQLTIQAGMLLFLNSPAVRAYCQR
jgi:tetratricopeptide (TPR) repeat protein